jgi:membrane associated rhomboid family serine protease
MTYTEQQYKQKISLGQSGNTLVLLIAISLIVFVGLAFLKAMWYFSNPKDLALPLFNKNVMGLFIMPADGNQLLSKPWTILTQMFVHDNVWKVFANMLWLWCFGYILQDLTGNKRIVPVFVYGALGGALAFILAYNFIPALQPLLPVATLMGASAGVMAVAVATTLISPGYRIFPLIGGGLPLWVLTAIYIISDLLTVSISDSGTLITHLAGGLTGALCTLFYNKGYDPGKWMNDFFDWVNDLFNPNKPKKGSNIKEELFYKSSSAPFQRTPNVTQERIDDILDKINQQGYSQLTDEEKDLLKRAGKEGL